MGFVLLGIFAAEGDAYVLITLGTSAWPCVERLDEPLFITQLPIGEGLKFD